ncbi:endonuclease III [Leptolyngbya sp. FACHB-17]|uniref:endonuclease III domain-containing protein n=1 Tax=unclassified Leptolyngbya TaxID=2650499 RepID=UPI0016816411|nr:endonuclease III [Leptolyngbya sp. FACHB-17]MBD2079653.1 endonuclease III [Leptolyngbya sp. FACHB-17]
MAKLPFDIDIVLDRVREAVEALPKAAMFELYEAGYTSLFEQLISCLISVRTYDEVSLPVSRRLFERARTPNQIAQLTPEEIETLIRECTYPEQKARQIHAIANQIVNDYAGELPADLEVLLSFKGIGVKCAHLALGIACRQPYISVDTHVHRITNRWGYVEAKTPEKTTIALSAKLSQRYWIEINQLLVPFGKHICTGKRPHCLQCPVLDWCEQKID